MSADTTAPAHVHVHADGTHHATTETPGTDEARPIDGPVMLDIGGDVGALIARLDDHLEGSELPILSLDRPDWDPNTHTGVWRRRLANTTAVVAVYPQLPEGRYQIAPGDHPPTELVISGGQVTDIDLRTNPTDPAVTSVGTD